MTRRKHQRRVLLNLLLTAVLALFLWAHDGYPLPTLEMELHRAERQTLAEESRVVWKVSDQSATMGGPVLAGVSSRWTHTYGSRYDAPQLALWPRSKTEPTLVILPDIFRYHPEGAALTHREEAPVLLAVDPPAGAETARLTIDFSFFSDKYSGWAPYVVQGARSDPFFLFQVEVQYERNSLQNSDLDLQESGLFFNLIWSPGFAMRTMDDFPYTLEFFDADGALIAAYDNPAAGGAVA